jgi:hypothetical protein
MRRGFFILLMVGFLSAKAEPALKAFVVQKLAGHKRHGATPISPVSRQGRRGRRWAKRMR